MFAGTYRVKLDPKGRLAIPHRMRDKLGDGSHISIGPDGALVIYTAEGFQQVSEAVPQLWRSSEQQRTFRRLLYSLAQPCDFDQQGRVTLSPEQRRFAGLQVNSTLAVVGAGDLIEIWPADQWDSYSAGAQPRFTELINEVFRA